MKSSSSSGISRKRRARCRAVIIACAVGNLCACTTLLTRDDYGEYITPPQALREIETQRLANRSQSKPITVEEASADIQRQEDVVKEPEASLELGLADVRAAALANNLDLKIELVNPSLADEVVSEEVARFEALLFGSANHTRFDTPPVGDDGPRARTRSNSFDVGMEIPLRTGGTITLDAPFGKTAVRAVMPPEHDAAFGEVSTSRIYDAAFSVSISQPLLRNAGIRTNTHRIRVAKYQKDISEARTKLEAIRILANADVAYWQLYAARGELVIRQEQHELAARQLSQAERRVEAGASPQIEIMRAESGVAERLDAIIVADTEVRRQERNLKRIMNRSDQPMSSATIMIPIDEPNPVGLDLDADALADFAEDNRMEMLELELRLAADASAVGFQRNGTLPLFALDYKYTVAGLSNGLAGAFSQMGSASFEDHSIGIRAEIPLGNLAAKSRLRAAMLRRVQRLATREQRRLAIRQEVYDAVDQLQQNWQRILAARREVLLAERTFVAETKQFEVGLRTSTEVLEAVTRVASAKSCEIRALASYEISQVDIAFATGMLLGRGGVIWEPTSID